MFKTDVQSQLYCGHYVPSNIDCQDCYSTEKDYMNRPLYAPLYVPLSNLSNVLDNSQLKLPDNFYIPFNQRSNNQSKSNNFSNDFSSDDCVQIKTKDGIVYVPRSNLIDRSIVYQSQQTFPGDFQKHAHRFTRSFSWKTKPEESSFAQMQPLPKLIKRPDYVEICCKNICWPTHQFCLCCGRNTAEICGKWSKATGEYDYVRACLSSCALCSDDAYKILNTPVVYNEKIIDPEVLLPLDAELLYYSIQSAKRQQEKQQDTSVKSIFPKSQSETTKNSQENQTADKDKSSTSMETKIWPKFLPKKPKKSTKKPSLSQSKSTRPGRKSSQSRSKSKQKSSRPSSRSKQKPSQSRSKSKRKSSRSGQKSSRSQSKSKRKSNQSKKRSKQKSKKK